MKWTAVRLRLAGAVMAFILVSFFLVRGANSYFADHFPTLIQKPAVIRQFLAGELGQAPFIDLTADTAFTAKKRREFWLWNGVEGAGLRLVENPELLASLYPGYPARMYRDSALWTSYLKREFGIESYLKRLPELAGQNFTVMYSWTGCFEIYKRYGADVLVFGTSETYRGLVPEELSGLLRQSGVFKEEPRVLFCSTSGMPLEIVELTANELARLSPSRPALILFGYSFWESYVKSGAIAVETRQKHTDFDNYRQDVEVRAQGESGVRVAVTEGRKPWMNFKLADAFPHLSWDDVLSLDLHRIRTYLAKRREANILTDEAVMARQRLVPESLKNSEEELKAVLERRVEPYYPNLQGVTTDDCELTKAEQQLDRALAALRKISDRVFIYLTPATPYQTKAAPDCLLASTVRLLQSKAIPRKVAVRTGGMDSYHLRYVDYLRPSQEAGRMSFDVNHTNYEGALKTTRELARWITSELETGR